MKITMLGHATLLIEMDGKTILTDPWLTDPLYWGQLSHPGNFAPPKELPDLDLVLVSHGHDDHFDPATLAGISKQTPVVIHKTYHNKARRIGFKTIYPVELGTEVRFDSLLIETLPGKHPGGISTFMITGDEGKVFFGGDSIYCDPLEQALTNSAPDVCLMPISGGKMGFIDFHMGPIQAVQLIKVAKPILAVPIHYHFTLKKACMTRLILKGDCLDEFQAKMADVCPQIAVKVLDYNQSWQK